MKHVTHRKIISVVLTTSFFVLLLCPANLAEEFVTQRLTIDASASGVYAETIVEGGVYYTLYHISETASYTDAAGKPKIPYLAQSFSMPKGAVNLRVEIISAGYEERYGMLMYPVPEEVVVEANGVFGIERVFTRDEIFYESDIFYPGAGRLAEIKQIGFSGEKRIISVACYPIQYNPKQRTARIYGNLIVSFRYDTPVSVPEAEQAPVAAGIDEFSAGADRVGTVSYPATLTGVESADYIIVAAPLFYDDAILRDFADYRAEHNGFDVAVVRTTDIYAQFPGTKKGDSVKELFEHAYYNWNSPCGENPQYALLVGIPSGDEAVDVPHQFVAKNETPTDHFYVCFNDDNEDGRIDVEDYVSEMAIGRFPVTNAEEVNNITSKIYSYESLTPVGGDWGCRFSFLIGEYVDYNSQFFKPVIVRNKKEWFFRTWWEPDMHKNNTTLSAVEQINEGRIFVHFDDHGNTDCWHRVLYLSDIDKLTNYNKYPLAFAEACLTGVMGGIGTKLVTAKDKGCIAYLGSTVISGDAYQFRLGMTKALFDEKITLLGNMKKYAELHEIGSLGKYRIFEYNIQGDPALDFSSCVSDSLTPELYAHVSFTPSYYAAPEDEITLNVEIFNWSLSPVKNVEVDIYKGDPDKEGELLGRHTIENIAPDASGAVTEALSHLSAGDYEYYVIVDPEDKIRELDDSNNKFGESLTIPPRVIDVRQLTDDRTYKHKPRVGDSKAVWATQDEGIFTIHILDLLSSTQEALPLGESTVLSGLDACDDTLAYLKYVYEPQTETFAYSLLLHDLTSGNNKVVYSTTDERISPRIGLSETQLIFTTTVDNATHRIWRYDLLENSVSLVHTTEHIVSSAAISNAYAVWKENNSIYVYDWVNDPAPREIIKYNPGTHMLGECLVSSDKLAYTVDELGGMPGFETPHLYLYDLNDDTNVEMNVGGNVHSIALSDKYLVWTDGGILFEKLQSPSEPEPDPRKKLNIYNISASSRAEFSINLATSETTLGINDNKVVWIDLIEYCEKGDVKIKHEIFMATAKNLPGDVNGDGKVDIRDLLIVARAFGSSASDPNWDARADLHENGVINIRDLLIVARNFGRSS